MVAISIMIYVCHGSSRLDEAHIYLSKGIFRPCHILIELNALIGREVFGFHELSRGYACMLKPSISLGTFSA